MHPDKKLTRKQFKSFFTPWHYAGIHMAWEGKWVSIQPVGWVGAAGSPRRHGPDLPWSPGECEAESLAGDRAM